MAAQSVAGSAPLAQAVLSLRQALTQEQVALQLVSRARQAQAAQAPPPAGSGRGTVVDIQV